MTRGARTNVARGLALLALGAVACKEGSPPELADPGDQQVDVGEQLTVELFATDPDGDAIRFSFSAAGVPDLDATTSLALAPDGRGIFNFTPLGTQVGTHIFDFTASDGTFDDSVSVSIDVRGASGAGAAPIFRQPLAEGTVLDLDVARCVQVEVLLEDPDSASLTLTQVPPTIPGSNFDVSPSGLEGEWSWCPDRTQRGQERWGIQLSASDGENTTLKDFLILVRAPSGVGCPGDAPVIEHAPADIDSVLDISLRATVTDDQGLKNAPLVLYAFDDPRIDGAVAFDQLDVAEMELEDGDRQDGTWVASIPNPVAGQSEGSSADLYYLIQATDDDDAEGECDHRTDNPSEGIHRATITNPGGDGGAGLCESCSFDVQCGGAEDLCLTQDGQQVCGTACEGGSGCPDGYTCAPVTSVDGASDSQCIPMSGSCRDDSGQTCEDDSAEPDDTPAESNMQGSVDPGIYDGVLCPGDPDWWLIELGEAASLLALLDGDAPPDMDLTLVDADEQILSESNEIDSLELVEGTCLAPGDYYVVVSMLEQGATRGEYSLEFELDADACANAGACCSTSASGGCEADSDIEMCVCDLDSFCCSSQWDATCVARAIGQCSAVCMPDDPDAGDCCEANGTTSCEYEAVAQCACQFNGQCCNNAAWTQGCVDTVDEFCGGCP